MEVLVRVSRRFSSSLRYRYRYKIRGNFVIHKAPKNIMAHSCIDNKEYKSTFSLTTYSQGEGGGG